MAVIIPQVVTEDRASGASVIDGSLRFDKDKLTHLHELQVLLEIETTGLFLVG